MKTPAERQKAVRDRRISEGGQRRLNMWISAPAYDALSALAKEKSMTRMQVLDALLLDLTAKPTVTASPKKIATASKTKKKVKKKIPAQVQFELPDLVTQSPK
jgi:hypothetical protein